MLRPAINQIATKNESYYSVVIAVAKRAREIADDLYNNNETLEEKPVKTAVEEFAGRKYYSNQEGVSGKGQGESGQKPERISAPGTDESNSGGVGGG